MLRQTTLPKWAGTTILHSNDDIIVNDIKKCETFNNVFLSHSSIDTSNDNLPELISNTINSLSDIAFTYQDISDMIQFLDVNKANGPDLISNRMLKEAGYSIVPFLYRLFRLSVDTSIFHPSGKKQM